MNGTSPKNKRNIVDLVGFLIVVIGVATVAIYEKEDVSTNPQLFVANETAGNWNHWFRGTAAEAQRVIAEAKPGDVLVINGEYGNGWAVENRGDCVETVPISVNRPAECHPMPNRLGGCDMVCTIKESETSSVQTGIDDAENDWSRFFDADDPLRPPRN